MEIRVMPWLIWKATKEAAAELNLSPRHPSINQCLYDFSLIPTFKFHIVEQSDTKWRDNTNTNTYATLFFSLKSKAGSFQSTNATVKKAHWNFLRQSLSGLITVEMFIITFLSTWNAIDYAILSLCVHKSCCTLIRAQISFRSEG